MKNVEWHLENTRVKEAIDHVIAAQSIFRGLEEPLQKRFDELLEMLTPPEKKDE